MKSKHFGSLAAAALVGGLLLSGCQQDPGTAARVGDTAIAASDVDLLSDAMCEEREDLAKQGHSAAAPRSLARDEALLSLIRVRIAEAFTEGQSLPIDNKQVNELSSQVAEQVSTIEDSERPRLRELIRGLLIEQQQMMVIAQNVFQAQGQQAPQDPGTLIAAGREAVLSGEDLPEVEVNPRFAGPQFKDFGATGADLSEPVSKAAKAAATTGAEPSVDGLPENLRCG